jgi:hypothetical protein
METFKLGSEMFFRNAVLGKVWRKDVEGRDWCQEEDASTDEGRYE